MAHSIYKYTSLAVVVGSITSFAELRSADVQYSGTNRIVSGDSGEQVLLGTFDKRATVTAKTNDLGSLVGVDPGDAFTNLKLTETKVGSATVATFNVSAGVVKDANGTHPWDNPGEATIVFEACSSGASAVTIAWASS